ncbi:udp-glucose 6-dehydrogenase [Lasius niger]|uniref:UDP-glucose 6-dehydrogenase n=1 Tax=Lasius niger TaxID=67767 RepID=A0A0J7KHU4_LASNI|nr:udp-glucose 6-dehydrogenase [Lasius niger]
MKLVVIGGGYVGLVSAVCFAKLQAEVVVLEKNKERLAALKRGESPIYEPGLSEALTAEIQSKRLSFTDSYQEALIDAEAVFIAVGTPTITNITSSQKEDKADLSQVFDAASSIAKYCQSSKLLVVTKSTVPVGTGRDLVDFLKKERPDVDFTLASNPEFLREGTALSDFMNPDRILIGLYADKAEESDRIKDLFKKLYAGLTQDKERLFFVSLESAELSKCASNAFLAMKVGFINEMADLCEATGADVLEVAKAMGLDERIGSRFLNPGPGVGGSCFPKDSRALAATARLHDLTTELVQAAIESNERRKIQLSKRVVERLGGDVKGKIIGVLGVSFKAGTDDVRDAPALSMLPYLLKAGAVLQVYDPCGMENAQAVFERTGVIKGVAHALKWMQDPEEVAEGADLVLLLTEWEAFKSLSPDALGKRMRGKKILDYRNFLDVLAFQKAGLEIEGLGRGNLVREHHG